MKKRTVVPTHCASTLVIPDRGRKPRHILRLRPMVMRLLTDQRGLNTVELVVIIAVVIGLALLFRARITGFVTTLLDGLFSDRTAAELVRGVSVP